MAQYKVRGPDGSTHIFQGPEGATPDQVVSAAQQFFSAPAAPTPAAPQGTGSSLLDKANAVASGFGRGLTRLAGLPVDAAANVRDLGKAAIGSGYIATTGKVPPDWLQIGDRSNDVGSGENLLKGARTNQVAKALVDPANPEYEGGYLQNAGSALTGVFRPQSALQAANQALLSAGGATAGKAAADSSGNPALGIAASLAPGAAQNGLVASAKYAVRGGEAGRVAMNQRTQDLQNAGVANPTLGLASGNQTVGGIENLLQSTPGAVGVMRDARTAALSGLQNKTSEAAQLASPRRGSLEAGTAIQNGIGAFKGDLKDTQDGLYNALSEQIPANTPAVVGNTRDALHGLTQIDPGAPNISARFVNGKINSIRNDFDIDAGVTRSSRLQSTAIPFGKADPLAPTSLTYKNSFGGQKWAPKSGGEGAQKNPPYSPSGTTSRTIQIPNTEDPGPRGVVYQTGNALAGSPGEGTWKPPANPTLPYGSVAKLRSQVGDELSNQSLVPDAPTAQWKRLYGGLSEDMRGAAAAAGPDAARVFNRANDHTRAGIGRLEKLAPFANKDAPEQAFNSLAGTLQDNGSIFQAVKKSLPEGARGTVAGTVIDRLGRAMPGAQNEAGDAWSPERFLTSWNKMTPTNRQELLSGFPNSDQVRGDIESVARATSMMRDSSKLWANPSGTAANATARGVLGAVTAGGAGAAAGLLSAAIPLTAAAGLGGVNLLARGLTSAKIRNAIGRPTNLDPELVNALAASIAGSGQLNQRQK